MSENFYKTKQSLEILSVPAELLTKVMGRIEKERKIMAIKRRVAIFSFSTIFSALAFILAFHSVQSRLAESGFMQFFSLIFSDFAIVSLYWQNFCLSLLGALPVMSLIIFLVTVLALLQSAKLLARNIKIISSFRQNF